ncbi:MAG: tripeptide aminopeptidase PepT [Sphaerochaetaceae bacterium]
MKEQLVKRFLRYVGFDTMSDPHNTKSRPSTANQMELLRVLQQELVQMGISDLTLDPNGYLIARLPATVEAPPIGFMAHVDVADDVMGNGVKPRLIEQYDGQDIVLANGLVLSTKENQELIAYKGEQLVVTDGTTLLGGDDKAGVAILMSVAAKLASDPSAKHPEVEFIFTTDEETGRGMDAFDISLIRSTVCYTVDGGSRGSVEAECFNAATATVDFYGIPLPFRGSPRQDGQ